MDLVILDNWGYLPFSQAGGALLFHLLSALYEHTSVVITANLDFAEWSTVFGNPKLTTSLAGSAHTPLPHRGDWQPEPSLSAQQRYGQETDQGPRTGLQGQRQERFKRLDRLTQVRHDLGAAGFALRVLCMQSQEPTGGYKIRSVMHLSIADHHSIGYAPGSRFNRRSGSVLLRRGQSWALPISLNL